jgi:hypothetical protein
LNSSKSNFVLVACFFNQLSHDAHILDDKLCRAQYGFYSSALLLRNHFLIVTARPNARYLRVAMTLWLAAIFDV